MAKRRGFRTVKVNLPKEELTVYGSPRLMDAFETINKNMNLYQGVKLGQIMEAIYVQGKKDGAREVFEELDKVKMQIPHRRPGRPPKK
jgi:hypothetical protein